MTELKEENVVKTLNDFILGLEINETVNRGDDVMVTKKGHKLEGKRGVVFQTQGKDKVIVRFASGKETLDISDIEVSNLD